MDNHKSYSTRKPGVGRIVVFCVIVGAVIALIWWPSSPHPTLVLQGYYTSSNRLQTAVLELKNPTKHTIWFRVNNSRPILELKRLSEWKWDVNDERNIMQSWNVRSFREVVPGETGVFSLQLRCGDPEMLVGLSFYAGTYYDSNGSATLMGTRPQPSGIGFYYDSMVRSFRGKDRKEVWCPSRVFFQTNADLKIEPR